MMWSSLIILIYLTSYTESVFDCCPGENVLSISEARCSTNVSYSLKCEEHEHKIPIDDVSFFAKLKFELLSNGTLINTANNNSEIKYCQSYPNSNAINTSDHVYIFCMNIPEDKFETHKISVAAALEFVSVFFIILTIIVYLMVPKLLDLQGFCMIHALVGLAAAYIFLGTVQLSSQLEQTMCTALAFLAYFSFLYMIFWMSILSFHIWRITVKPRFSTCTSKWGIVYHIFGTAGPLICLMILLSAHYSPSEIWNDIRPNIGQAKCWFQSMRETMIYFYAPITILLCFNVAFYVWTVKVLWSQVGSTGNKILKYRLKLCVRLLIIMGLTWIFEIITAALQTPEVSLFYKIFFFLLDLFNILQGLLIFLILVVFRKSVRRALASKNICNIKFPNSWRYLEDDEMGSVEERINCTVAEYKENEVEIKR